MGRLFVFTLEGNIYSCKHCGIHLAHSENIVSKETAHEMSQKYKEGKSVLERFKICGPDVSHYSASHDIHVAGSDVDDV
ncbi:protein yippee-like isoform X2 [Solanum lycopersicum]|uniref:protein yippee-like isoform X2 n=1 Tax=Solanum lycopersicum TaxID=4081 RepID=UPI003748E071